MNEAIRLAKIGAVECASYFGHRLFFTQSLIFGAIASGEYKVEYVVTPSQYGKSYVCADIGIWTANKGEKVYACGGTDDASQIIMEKVMDNIQDADEEIKSKLLESDNKIERLQASVSKKKLAMIGGGVIQNLSLGESYKDHKRGIKQLDVVGM